MTATLFEVGEMMNGQGKSNPSGLIAGGVAFVSRA